jgi:hypothetical protein
MLAIGMVMASTHGRMGQRLATCAGHLDLYIKEPIMAAKIQKVDVWSAEIPDRAGALDTVLGPLAAAGADLSFLVARRQPDKPGLGIVFLGGLKGAKQTSAAQKVGLSKPTDVTGLIVEVANKPGLAHKLVERLAAAGISMRGMLACVTGTKCVMQLAFDTTADRDKAAKLLAK